ncbi:MAG: DUF983 domain-containing protein [Pseudomonadota bacterium]
MTDRVPVSPYVAGLRGACPRCGEGKLFKGFLGVQDRCGFCGLSFDQVDSGDGPAVFVMFIVGFIVVAAALFVEVSYAPPLWAHMALWFPLTAALSGLMLRPMKATMIALQYHHKAAEGVLDE